MRDPTLVFLGCGHAALTHARILRSVAPGTARFFASRVGEKARSFSESYGGSGWFNSYDGALQDPRVAIAVITTPPATHLALTLEALRAGKHVVVEKPAFLNLAELDEVASAAAQSGRTVLVAENYFYKPVATMLRRLIAESVIGDLKLVWLNATKWQRPASWRADPILAGGGPLFEGGVHWINLLANLGPAVQSITSDECGGPLTTLTRIRYANGATAVLAYSWETRSRLNGIHMSRIWGSAGTISFESNGLFISVRGTRRRWVIPGLRDITGHRAMWTDFIAALGRQQQAQFTLERARVDIALLERIATNQTEPEVEAWTA